MITRTCWLAAVAVLLSVTGLFAAERPDVGRFELEVLATGLNDPMQAAPLPNGDVLFIERAGHVKRFLAAERRVRTLGQVQVKLATELGLLGMALDRHFATNQRLFLFLCPLEKPDHLRVVRGQLDATGRLRESELERLLEYPFDPDGAIHMGGGLAMNPTTGDLWIGTGDNCPPIPELPVDLSPDGRLRDAYRTSANTQDLRGKLLRIRPRDNGGYSIPSGNLFADSGAGRPEIFAMGVRNAFRFAVDPASNRVAWGDVGPNIDVQTKVGPNGYDEVNLTATPGNFGWPLFIGPNEGYRAFDFQTREAGKPFDASQPMNPSPRNLGLRTLPPARGATLWYPSTDSERFPSVASGGRSAMAGPFFHADPKVQSPERLPDYYDGCVFVYDWTRNWIQALWPTPENSVERLEPLAPHLEIRKPIDLQLAADHSLVLVEFGDKWGGNQDGRLLRLVYRRGNRPPVAHMELTPPAGSTPLKVQLSASASTDPDDEPLTYRWEIHGDVREGMKVEHVFQSIGEYRITLTVTDPHGASGQVTESIVVGNSPPEVTLVKPANGGFFDPNQTISVQVNVEDREDLSIDVDRVSIEAQYLGTRGHENKHPGLNLMRSTTCFSCHQTETRSVGPAYLEIAKRYEDSSKNRALLTTKILSGGFGNWPSPHPETPPIPMPPHPQHTQDEAGLMVDWILGLDHEPNRNLASGLTADFRPPSELDRRLEGGRFAIRASYADRGGRGVRSLVGAETHILHARQRRVALHDGAENIQIVDVFEGGSGLVARFHPNSWLRINNLSLHSIRSLEIRRRYFNNVQGPLELRLGGTEGMLLTKLEATHASPQFENERIVISSPPGMHDLYLVSQGYVEVAWIRFLEE